MMCKSALTHFLHSCKFGDHLHTQENEKATGIVSFPSHLATTTDFPHLETVSLVHQKPLPLGREMHLLCIL